MMSTPATTPIGDHTLTRPDGRRVAWSEWGRAKGPPMLLLHRNPGSWLLDPDSAATAASELRLLTVDRPGYGGTDPVVEPTAAAASRDVTAVVGELRLHGVARIGWSRGRLFALDAAAPIGDRVRSLSLICTPAPDHAIPWIPDAFRPLVESVRADPRGALASITEACAFYANNPETAVASDPS